MLALLGMGRSKKEKEREKEPDKDHAIARADVGADSFAEDTCPSPGAVFPSGNSIAAQPTAAARTQAITQSQSSGLASNANGTACGGQGRGPGQAEPNCDCCGRSHPDEAHGAMTSRGSTDAHGSAQSLSGTRSIVPAPPAGPVGFSSPAVPSMLQPLTPKVFAVEVSAVELGLHIQLGQAGAKTEAQLGDQQLGAAKRLRHLLITNRARMIQELLSRGWVPLLLRWLGLVHRPNLQVEALSALTTVAQNTTEHTPILLKHGAVGTLVSLLKSPSLEMVEQAMWVLGKMAQDGQEGTRARDAVFQAGVLGPLVRCLEQHPTLVSLQRIGAWSLFNLFDGQPRPTVDVSTVNMVMPAINRLLTSGDSEVLSHACSALSHLCDGSAAHIKVVVESGVCTRLVQLLDHPSSQVVKPALRTIGNVVCAEDDADYTEAILEAGSVVCLKRLIAHPNREIQKEACWTLSNIAAGSVSQIQSVLDSGAMPQLIKLATSADTESEVRSEAFWVVLNAASCGSDAQIEYLVSQGCVQILSDLLGESSMVMMALEGIERVLSVGDLRVVRNAIASHSHADQEAGAIGDHCIECASVAAVGAAAAAAAGGDGTGGGLTREAGAYTNPYASMLTPEKIQALEAHKNSAVAKRANRVWARYFVTCAICRRSFSRHGSTATFCTECKCYVCGSCDCTVFHLAYQDRLWEEMEGKEKKGKQAQQAAKKNKKAKKREKKKLAAKESALEPAVEAGKDKNIMVGGEGTKSHIKITDVVGVAGGRGKEKGNGEAVERSQVLGKKPHHRPPSPHKTSSSASTESNSEDEYSPSPPQNAYNTITTPNSAAAALINATAMAVNAAATTHKIPAKKRSTVTALSEASLVAVAAGAAVVAATAGNGPSSKSSEGQQRRPGKKQGRRDQPQQGSNGDSFRKPPISRSSSPSIRNERGGKSVDDSEEPWVVVGSKSGVHTTGATIGKRGPTSGGSVGTKSSKRGEGHRVGDGALGGLASSSTPPGGGDGTSVVEWASESSPGAVMPAVTTRSRVVSPFSSAAGPKVSPPPPLTASPAQGVRPISGRSGSGNPWGVTPKPTPSHPISASVVASPNVIAPSSMRTTSGTNGTHVAPSRRRPGPGPGSVWGAPSTPMVDARPKIRTAASDGSPAGKSGGAPGVAVVGQASLDPDTRKTAGVIGPPLQAQAVAKMLEPSSTRSGAIGPSSPLPSLTQAPSSLATSSGTLHAASGVTEQASSVEVVDVSARKHSNCTSAAAFTCASAAVRSRPAAVPAEEGGGGALIRDTSGAGDGEALVENEKLVSFLMETGSILALAQRLEEEEDWRRSAPSPASSGPT